MLKPWYRGHRLQFLSCWMRNEAWVLKQPNCWMVLHSLSLAKTPFCLVLIIEQARNRLATALLYTMSAKPVLHSSVPQNIKFLVYSAAFSLPHPRCLLKPHGCWIHARVACALLKVLPPVAFQLRCRCSGLLLVPIPEIRALLNLPALLISVRQLN